MEVITSARDSSRGRRQRKNGTAIHHPNPFIGRGAFAGLATFPIVVIILNLVQWDQYNALTQPMSQLALGRGGWLMAIGFCATGLGILLVALLIRRTVQGARAVPVLLGLAGVLHFVAAAFPTDPTGVPLTVHGLIHNMGGLITLVLAIAAMVIAGFSFRASPAWRSFSRATFVWSGGATVAFFLMFVLAGMRVFGVGQRILVAAWLSWLLVVAWRALSSSRSQERLNTLVGDYAR